MRAPTEDYTLEAWQNVVDVNLTGVFRFSQAAARQMIAQGERGRSSISARSPHRTAFPLVSWMPLPTLHRRDGSTRSPRLGRQVGMAWDQRERSRTRVVPADMSGPVLDRDGEELLAKIPLGRFGRPSHLKGGVLYLATRASNFVTGHMLVVDDGQSVA